MNMIMSESRLHRRRAYSNSNRIVQAVHSAVIARRVNRMAALSAVSYSDQSVGARVRAHSERIFHIFIICEECHFQYHCISLRNMHAWRAPAVKMTNCNVSPLLHADGALVCPSTLPLSMALIEFIINLPQFNYLRAHRAQPNDYYYSNDDDVCATCVHGNVAATSISLGKSLK